MPPLSISELFKFERLFFFSQFLNESNLANIVFQYHQSQKMTIELLDTETESQNSEQDENARKWNS